MAISIKHAFNSPKANGTDATLIQPSHWNAALATNITGGNLVGRVTAGEGAFEEIPTSAFMAGLLASADAATLAGKLGILSTGDVKFSISPTAPAGWIVYNTPAASLGNVGAPVGVSFRGAIYKDLYFVVWNNITEAYCPMTVGARGGTAQLDWDANRGMYLPTFAGRVIVGAGPALGLTARVNGQLGGLESVTLTGAQSGTSSHFHDVFLRDVGHTHYLEQVDAAGIYNSSTGTATPLRFQPTDPNAVKTKPGGGGISIGSDSAISRANTTANANAVNASDAHENMPPYVALWTHIKL
jgi:hypothetical protein